MEIVRILGFALRALRRSPWSSLTIVGVLALGIGAATAVYSVARAVLLTPLPYRDPERLLWVWSEMTESGYTWAPLSEPELVDLRERCPTLEDLAGVWPTTGALVEDGRPETLRLALVTANVFALLGTPPELGRWLRDEDASTSSSQSVILSGGLWQRRFGSDPKILGRRLRVDGGWGFPGGTFTVVGVMPLGFEIAFPSEAGVPRSIDAWIPLPGDLRAGARAGYYLRALGRLRPGASLQAAAGEIDEIGSTLAREHAEYAGVGRRFHGESLSAATVRSSRPVVLAILSASGLVLLIACCNAANLLLTQIARRRSEVAVRCALGASPIAVLRQFLLESLLLGAAGGLAGLLVARLLLALVRALAPADVAGLETASLDLGVLAAAAALSLLAGGLSAAVPVAAAVRLDPARALRSGRSAVGAASGRIRDLLVIAQVAQGVALLIAAALMTLTFLKLLRVDPGYAVDDVLTFDLNLPASRYPDGSALARFARDLEDGLERLPGVEAAGATNQLPLAEVPNWSTPYRLRGGKAGQAVAFEADARLATPGYLRALRARTVSGRLFDDSDHEQSRRVVIVDSHLASRAWPGESAVGKELEIVIAVPGQGFVPVWAEVVGVVEHLRHRDLGHDVREQVYVPFLQGPRNQMAVVVQSSRDPLTLVAPIRQVIAELDPELATSRFAPLRSYVAAATAGKRFASVLVGGFAIVALLLSTVAIHSVLAHAVVARTPELGLRLALGARPRGVVGLVLVHGLRLLGLGTALGMVAALALGRLLRSQLYQVSPADPAAYLGVATMLGVCALAAMLVPAWRAARVDPMQALRQE